MVTRDIMNKRNGFVDLFSAVISDFLTNFFKKGIRTTEVGYVEVGPKPSRNIQP